MIALSIARCLLRGHVGWRPQDRARLGQLGIALDPLGQAEVGDVGLALGVDHDVRGLQVAVQDAPLVRMVDGPGDRGHRLRGSLGSGGGFRQPLGEAAALDQLHREVAEALVLADLVDRHDVRVVEVGDRLGLEAKPAQRRPRRPAARRGASSAPRGG